MTTLQHDATTFADRALTGLLAANPALRRVDGGVVRRGDEPQGRVAVVIGGGSGHYPAFAGLVGPGLATGAAYGNVFASPSGGQVYRVAKAAEHGGGVLLTFGNYAGDVLNFGQAAERLRAGGIDVRVVEVTDDIASGGADEVAKRRGIAGALVVYKVAGAAAAAGQHLDGVEAVARRANANTFSFGVAFAGCTLPGADEPLFTVDPGTMSVGLGIHGEPGIEELPLPSPEQLADLLTERLLAQRPDGSPDRAVVLLNGLGTFKYEELFVLYGLVAERLGDAGVQIVQPEVGETTTSLDMSGVSLTLSWLDDELLELWAAPASSPAYTKVPATAEAAATADRDEAQAQQDDLADEDTRHAAEATAVLAGLQDVAELIIAASDELGRLDAIAGDGDHGIGMSRGVTAAVESAEYAAERGAGIGPLLAEAGDGWSEHAGGTSGAIWGVLLTSAGASLAGEKQVGSTEASARATAAALEAVQRLGKAQVGDKTLIDAFAPLVDALQHAADQNASLADAWAAAADAAESAAQATADLKPKLGRARPLAEKSIGHPDPGAVSFARIAARIAERIRNG
ncbi:dihydroxyacetone kinase family protein [uncultured Amnibacterium sp.]|uniref:dihydroxyacetone kinase family protein n=1 Tax=uncultured Amnibacterium sp. TaxID=1631851 RepID=UPI0035CA6B5D